MTARDLIEGAFRLIGVLASGESLDAAQGQDGISALNGIIQSWSNDNLLIFKENRETFTFVSNQGSYTLNSGNEADFITSTNPMFIDRVSLLDNQSGQSLEYPINIVSMDQYAMLSNKSIATDYPNCVWITSENSGALLRFYPIPASAKECVIYYKSIMQTVPNLSENIDTYRNGYARALKYELASELSIEYGKQLDPRVTETLKQLKRSIRVNNAQELKSVSDIYNLNNDKIYNIWTRNT